MITNVLWKTLTMSFINSGNSQTHFINTEQSNVLNYLHLVELKTFYQEKALWTHSNIRRSTYYQVNI